MLASYEQPQLGSVRAVGLPLKISGFQPHYQAAPTLGADEESLLTGLGYGDSDVVRLRQEGAFGSS
jgi:crotonobetainyl-CoA:carnitine CoA-transferase CaiB-like acyl-CoA transferase